MPASFCSPDNDGFLQRSEKILASALFIMPPAMLFFASEVSRWIGGSIGTFADLPKVVPRTQIHYYRVRREYKHERCAGLFYNAELKETENGNNRERNNRDGSIKLCYAIDSHLKGGISTHAPRNAPQPPLNLRGGLSHTSVSHNQKVFSTLMHLYPFSGNNLPDNRVENPFILQSRNKGSFFFLWDGYHHPT